VNELGGGVDCDNRFMFFGFSRAGKKLNWPIGKCDCTTDYKLT
jgi:hypothetical protein